MTTDLRFTILNIIMNIQETYYIIGFRLRNFEQTILANFAIFLAVVLLLLCCFIYAV